MALNLRGWQGEGIAAGLLAAVMLTGVTSVANLVSFTMRGGHIEFDPSPPWNERAVAIQVIGVKPARQEMIENFYTVDELNDRHSGAEATKKCYSKRYPLAETSTVAGYEFEQTSASSSSDLQVNVLDDGSTVEMSFCLTAGPLSEPYSGRLQGTLKLVEQRRFPPNEIELSVLKVEDSGNFAIADTAKYPAVRLRVGTELIGTFVDQMDTLNWTDTCAEFKLDRMRSTLDVRCK